MAARRCGPPTAANGVLLILAVPGVLFGLFFLMLLVRQPSFR